MIKIGAWNIRGYNDPSKQHEVRHLIQTHKLSCIALIETKVKACNKDKIGHCLLKGWKYYANFDDDLARIWIWWNPHILHVNVLQSMNQVVHLSLQIAYSEQVFYTSFVYGSNDVLARRELWHNLKTTSMMYDQTPWLIMGDFNAIRFRNERKGGSYDWPSHMNELDDTLIEAGLDDLRFGGMFFTWHNSRAHGHILRKLDRALINVSWLSSFPNAFAEFHPFGLSDHSPVIVDLGLSNSSIRRPFKFFNYWTEFDEFIPLVEQIWSTHIEGYTMYKVCKKLKLLKEALKVLSSRKNKEMDANLEHLRIDLAAIQDEIATHGGNELRIAREKECSTLISNANRQIESYAKQRSRVSKEGKAKTWKF